MSTIHCRLKTCVTIIFMFQYFRCHIPQCLEHIQLGYLSELVCMNFTCLNLTKNKEVIGYNITYSNTDLLCSFCHYVPYTLGYFAIIDL